MVFFPAAPWRYRCRAETITTISRDTWTTSWPLFLCVDTQIIEATNNCLRTAFSLHNFKEETDQIFERQTVSSEISIFFKIKKKNSDGDR